MPRYYRKILKITALESPNVQRGFAKQRGDPPETWPEEVPGVISWDEYQQRLATWDQVKQTIGLCGEFYLGADVLLFPPIWLDRAAEVARRLNKSRKATHMGIDPAEGGDSTAYAIGDENGLIYLFSVKTPDTSVVPAHALKFMRQFTIEPENIGLDAGGGGKQHADRLRDQGYNVRVVRFGAQPALELRRMQQQLSARKDILEDRYAYLNLRGQMYFELSEKLDPAANPKGFGLPAEYTELRRQLAPIPRYMDSEGRQFIPPKHAKSGEKETKDKVTLDKLIGCSPDEADAVVIMLHLMLHKAHRPVAGAVV